MQEYEALAVRSANDVNALALASGSRRRQRDKVTEWIVEAHIPLIGFRRLRPGRKAGSHRRRIPGSVDTVNSIAFTSKRTVLVGVTCCSNRSH